MYSTHYTFLLASLTADQVQMIINISCLVPLESSWAGEHNYEWIIPVTFDMNDYWNENLQESLKCVAHLLKNKTAEEEVLTSRLCLLVCSGLRLAFAPTISKQIEYHVIKMLSPQPNFKVGGGIVKCWHIYKHLGLAKCVHNTNA